MPGANFDPLELSKGSGITSRGFKKPSPRQEERCENCRGEGMRLRQVVAERGKDHAVDTVWFQARSGPGIAGYVRILRTPLQTAMIHLVLGTVVELEPEPASTLDQDSCIGSAVGAKASGTESTAAGNSLGVAALIGEE